MADRTSPFTKPARVEDSITVTRQTLPGPRTAFGLSGFALALRAITRDGEPWFVAKDVCDAIGHGNPSVAVQALEDDETAKFNLGSRPTNVVSESGMYALILRSRKPEAKAFRKWVTSEVLPTIRNTGGYMTPEVAQTAVTDPTEFLARAILIEPPHADAANR